MFPKYLQTYYGVFMLQYSEKKWHTTPLSHYGTFLQVYGILNYYIISHVKILRVIT